MFAERSELVKSIARVKIIHVKVVLFNQLVIFINAGGIPIMLMVTKQITSSVI